MARCVMRIAIDLIAGLLIASLPSVAFAQQMRDPTRPPSVAAAKPVKKGARGGMVLQTVVISPERRTAVISGRVLSVGDTVSGFRLTEIREGEVVMKGSRGSRTLSLYPSVSKVDIPGATSETSESHE